MTLGDAIGQEYLHGIISVSKRKFSLSVLHADNSPRTANIDTSTAQHHKPIICLLQIITMLALVPAVHAGPYQQNNKLIMLSMQSKTQ